jgi:hypothetical protein
MSEQVREDGRPLGEPRAREVAGVVRRRDGALRNDVQVAPGHLRRLAGRLAGAFITALFFEVGKAAIGFYIGKQGLESTYGAAASIVVVLIWVYYTSQIILMGAEVIAKRRAPPVSRTRRRSRSRARSSGRTILAK